MPPKGILVYYHCRSNTGYAIGRHEPDFLEMAEQLTGSLRNVHLGYTSLKGGHPDYVPPNFANIIVFDPKMPNPQSLKLVYDYIKHNEIDTAFGFDQPVANPFYTVMRKAGVKVLVSYWGAPMSSLNHGMKLLLKRVGVALTSHKPDHYIFQSEAMADSAVLGRGIPRNRVSVIPNAVDTKIFYPDKAHAEYAYNVFDIPRGRKLFFYSGHMEDRKGVHVIVNAAKELLDTRKREDIHFLILGNRGDEACRFENMISKSRARDHITFGGYRNDVDCIHKSCYAGIIASTGWDSFTMSSMEMASSGLPLIVSRLQGLKETIIDGKTGLSIEPGSHLDLADKIELLTDDHELRDSMSEASRVRVVEKYNLEKHISDLVSLMTRLYSRHG
ncbi:glycosyltransferase family 4 protein [Geomonas paludis]|uniref:Glycosyltransferase family 4 protein n=1 Tax=Geomonas paludis TaxID=2740185 RepID=A0A6V8MU37_9BACT|nr:glycosyltransferase family 4 protein [Geomonas paludis]UPU37765.1 glycosyltransferase family 4 protein [Geomonas paludis]GFO63695.1 hypothetical protein GMPD_16140 [Geomonas paludis]